MCNCKVDIVVIIIVMSIPVGPDDYIGGSFGVLLGSAAGAVSCQDISIVLGDAVQELENFFVVLNVGLEGAVAGEPNRATVTIGGEIKRILLQSVLLYTFRQNLL